MNDRLAQTSRFLSFVLRHNPDALGIDLEPGGWVDVSLLIERAQATGQALSRTRLKRVLDAGEKTRFSLNADESKIRANYGHSVDVDLGLTPTPPPDCLYHGTARGACAAIRDDGLRPQSRQHVHLSSTPVDARSVGKRHGTPVVLTIAAPSLHEAGYTLYRATDTVWLTKRVPPSFIQFPDADASSA